MKYIIEDKKLFKLIYNFINDLFFDDNLDWEYDTDYDTDKKTENILNFYGEKYVDGHQDDWYFQYVKREYYENIKGTDLAERWMDKAPLLDIISNEFSEKLNAFFGEYWKPVFEQWFKDTYPEFPVKTYIYHR